MKYIVEPLLANALSHLQAQDKIPSSIDSKLIHVITVDRTKNHYHGDFATNLALVLSKACNKPAHQMAEWIVAAIPTHVALDKIVIAEPGFINFFLKPEAWSEVVAQVLKEGDVFGLVEPRPYLQQSKLGLGSTTFIQYAHARICSVLHQLRAFGLPYDETMGLLQLGLLTASQELVLMALLSRYPEVVAHASETALPYPMALYLHELADGLHGYFNAIQLICEDEMQRQARLCLFVAVRYVLKNGLQLLGVSSPESVI